MVEPTGVPPTMEIRMPSTAQRMVIASTSGIRSRVGGICAGVRGVDHAQLIGDFLTEHSGILR